jgi:hypothetical protein
VQRQRLGIRSRPTSGEGFEPIAPWGKNAGIAVQGFQQQGDHQLGQDPRLSDGQALVRQPAELEQLLEPFEGQLDLPAVAIEFEHAAGVEQRRRQGGKDHHQVSSLKRARVEPFTFLAGALGDTPGGLGGQRGRQSRRHHPATHRGARRHQQLDWPYADLADPEPFGLLQSVKGTLAAIDHRSVRPA